MAEKILVLNGSPRKERSGTLVLTKPFVAGIESTGDFETEYVNIADLNVTPCKGCFHCWKTYAQGECAIKNDDVPAIKAKIEEAKYVVVSMPLYYFGIPGQVKTLLDRLLGMVNACRGRPIRDKFENGEPLHGERFPKPERKFALISGCAWIETDITYAPMFQQLDYIFGKDNYGRAVCPQLDSLIARGGDRRINLYKKNYEAAGVEFANNGKLSEETQALLSKPAFSPAVYQQLLDTMWDSEGEHN